MPVEAPPPDIDPEHRARGRYVLFEGEFLERRAGPTEKEDLCTVEVSWRSDGAACGRLRFPLGVLMAGGCSRVEWSDEEERRQEVETDKWRLDRQRAILLKQELERTLEPGLYSEHPPVTDAPERPTSPERRARRRRPWGGASVPAPRAGQAPRAREPAQRRAGPHTVAPPRALPARREGGLERGAPSRAPGLPADARIHPPQQAVGSAAAARKRRTRCSACAGSAPGRYVTFNRPQARKARHADDCVFRRGAVRAKRWIAGGNADLLDLFPRRWSEDDVPDPDADRRPSLAEAQASRAAETGKPSPMSSASCCRERG